MDQFFDRLTQFLRLSTESWVHVVDVALVSFLIYRVLLIVRNTRAWRILGGIVIFVLALFLSDFLGLRTLHWMLDKATVLAPVALVILLLPELRQALEGVAKLGLWPSKLVSNSTQATSMRTIEEIVASAAEMSSSRIGALIVVERQSGLGEVIENGVIMEAKVSAPLLTSVFFHGNPLHDGAAIIRGDEVVAAACRLPLSENDRISRQFHMRHRAAIGITEQSDALAIVVSEERGTMGLASNGQLRLFANAVDFRAALVDELGLGTKDRRSGKKSGATKK